MKANVPKGMGGMNNMQSMIKQAQKMQEDMAKAQEELNEKEYVTSVGGGVVEVTVTGKKEVKAIKIKPEAVDPDDIEMLEDLVMAAINEALRTAEDENSKVMDDITGGLNIPGVL